MRLARFAALSAVAWLALPSQAMAAEMRVPIRTPGWSRSRRPEVLRARRHSTFALSALAENVHYLAV
jgi:hypothetical protein